jgi:hypothetical protein
MIEKHALEWPKLVALQIKRHIQLIQTFQFFKDMVDIVDGDC